MEMFFLSYVNETMHLLWNLPFFKMVLPKTNIFSFLKPWANNSSTNQYSYQLFYGWGMTHLCHPISKMHIVERGLVKLLQPCGASHLINSFPTDVKQLAKSSKGGTLRPTSDVDFRSFSVPFSL